MVERVSELRDIFSFNELDASGRYEIGTMPARSIGTALGVMTPKGWGKSTSFSVGSSIDTEMIANSKQINVCDAGDNSIQDLAFPQIGDVAEKNLRLCSGQSHLWDHANCH